MAIKDIKGCSLIDGEYLGCAHCGGGWVRQTTKHLQERAAAKNFDPDSLPCDGLRTSVRDGLERRGDNNGS